MLEVQSVTVCAVGDAKLKLCAVIFSGETVLLVDLNL